MELKVQKTQIIGKKEIKKEGKDKKNENKDGLEKQVSKWYDGKVVQWIFCTFIPFAFLAAYPIIILSYYTIAHTVMAQVFVQIALINFYIKPSKSSLDSKEQQLKEIFIKKQTIQLKDYRNIFFKFVMILESLNLLSKIIFVIIYYSKEDLQIENIKNVLLDLEFFFVSDQAKQSGVQKAKMILLSFIPNILLFSVFVLASRIYKNHSEVRIEELVHPSNQKAQGLLNFLVLVSLASCQIFNPSIMAFGFLGLSLISQIVSLISSSQRKMINAQMIIQSLIQFYCFAQFFLNMFSATNTFLENNYFESQFIGVNSIAEFSNGLNQHPFYILSLVILFFLSVFYLQKLNYEKSRWSFIPVYQQIEKEKKKNRLKKALVKLLSLKKQNSNILETKSELLPRFDQDSNNQIIHYHTINDQDRVQIELQTYNDIRTEQQILDKNQDQSQDNADALNHLIIQDIMVDEIIKNPNTQGQKANRKQKMTNSLKLGTAQVNFGNDSKGEIQQDDNDNNQNQHTILSKIRKNNKSTTYTPGLFLKKQQNNQQRGSFKVNQHEQDEQIQDKVQKYAPSLQEQKEKGIEIIRQQLIKIERGEEDNIDNFLTLKKQDILYEESIQPESYLIANQKTSKDKFSAFKTKLYNYILDLSSRSFIYIKSQFEDSIIPIRFLQCCSILIIMRYPCYYSLGLISWCLLSSIFKLEIKIKFLFITLVPIPCIIIIYAFNLYGSIQLNYDLYPKHGFVYQRFFWLESIIFNTIIFLFFTYLLILRRLKQNLSSIVQSQKEKSQEKIEENSNNKQNLDAQQNDNSKSMIEQNIKQIGEQNNDFIQQRNSEKQESVSKKNSSPYNQDQVRFTSKSDPIKGEINLRFSKQSQSSVAKLKADQENENEQNQRIQSNSYTKSDKQENDNKNSQKIDYSQQKPVSLMTIFFALILKYSQTLALFLLYWIGFYTINIIHLLLVVLFLIFFQNSLKTIKIKKNGKIYVMSFSFKYWFILLIYLGTVIFAKFIYTILQSGMNYMGEQNSDNNQDSYLATIINFIGINYEYDMPFSLSLSKDDYAGLSIIWIAFMFATLQEDTFRSETYQKYSNKIIFLIQDQPIIKKYCPNFLFYTNKITILGENLLYWLSFFGITTCLILQDFSFINSFLLLLSFLLVFYYIFKYKDPQAFKYKKYYKIWYFFNQIIIAYILLCYILQFTSLKFVQDYIINPNSQAYQTFKDNRAIYGFYPELGVNDNLRYTFFPIIFVLYFAIFVQNYLKMIYNAVKHHNKGQIRDKSESNCSVISDNQKRLLSERENITIDIINKNYQKARREENRQIYINYVLFDIYSEVSSGVYQILKGLQFIMIDIQNMLVFLFAMVFRLSISMLIFIIIYLKFYYRYHNQLETFLEKSYMKKSINYFFKSFQKFYSFPQKNLGWKINLDPKPPTSNKNGKKQQEIQQQDEVIISSNQLKNLQVEKANDTKLKEQDNAENEQNKIEQEQSQKQNSLSQNKNLQALRRQSKKDLIECKIQEKIEDFITIQQKLKIDEQIGIWPYSFWFSYICISITYGAQFLATDFAKSNISNYVINFIQWAFFIFGTSCNTLSLSSIFRNIYFYLIMFWMNIIIFVLIRMKKQHEQNVMNQKQELQSQSQLNKNSQIQNRDSSAKKGESNQNNPLNYDDFRASKSPAINSEFPRNSSSYSQQLNRLTYLHLNQAQVADVNIQEGEQKLAFESERLKRVQKSEKEVGVVYYQEGGLLPQRITWCKLIYKHFKLTEEESEDEDNNEAFIQKTQFIEGLSPNYNHDNIFKQQNKDKTDSIIEKNYDDAFKNEIENSIEDEGSINQIKNKLDGYAFNVQSPNILKDQYEQKQEQSDEEKKQELQDEILIKKRYEQKILKIIRAEEEERQKKMYREDPDFIYNNYLRIQYFYQMKSCYVKQKFKSGLLLALYPFYSVILMHVSEQKHDVFSYIYLLVAFLGNSIKAINRNTIFLVLIQYILLLVNINQQTSPLQIDQYLLDFKSMSLIQQYITDKELLQYLAFNSSNQSSAATISFILNCLVFTVIGIYFNCYKFLVNSIIRNIQKVKNKVKYIYENNLFPQQIAPISIYKIDQAQKKQQENQNGSVNNPDSDQIVHDQILKNQKFQLSNNNLSTYSIEFTDRSDSKYEYQYDEDGQLINPIQPLWINYQNWKSQTFQFVNLMYEISISFGYIICAVLIMIISCQYLDIFNFIILAYNMIIFFIIEFVVPFPQMLNQRKKIQNLLRVLQFYLYAVFALYSTMQIPYVRNNISATGQFLSYQFLNLKIIDKIYIMFCIMCTQLLISSQDFKTITFSLSQSYILNANLSHKALSIHQNDQTISELLKNEKERRSLREVVRKVTQTLKNWHKSQSYIQPSIVQQQNNQNKNLNTSLQINQFQSSKNLQNTLPARSQSAHNVPLSCFSNQMNTRSDSKDSILYEQQGLISNQIQRGFQNKSKSKNIIKNNPLEAQTYQKDKFQQTPINKQNQETVQDFQKNDQNSPTILINLASNEKQEQNNNQLLQNEEFSKKPDQQHITKEKALQKKDVEIDELDYSSDESIGNIDEVNHANSGIQIKKYDFPRISQIKINNLENLQQQQFNKQDQLNNSSLKRMKISRVSSVDHLEQNLLFDQQSALKKSFNINQQKDTDSSYTTRKVRNQSKEKSVCFQKQKVVKTSRKKSLKDKKQEKANKYHNVENIQAVKKYQKDSDSEDSEDSQVSLFNSSEIVDEEDNDLMDQIKQQFDNKIQKQKEEEEALLQGSKQAKRETSHKILIKICKLIESQVNPLLFMDTVQISDYILKNNCQIFSKIYINIQDLLLGNLTSLMEYSHLLSIVYYCIYQTIQEAGVEFAFNNLFAIIQRATECDEISKIIYDSLIETSSQYPTIPYYYHLRKEQEKNITDKKIIQREQRNNLDHICIYHPQIPMYIYNVKSTNSLPFNLLTKFGLLKRLLKSFFKMVLSNWQFVCFFFFLMYYFSNTGLMSMPFPCLVFLNFLIEIKFVSLQIWMISFIYVTFLLIFKFIIQINGIYMDTQLQNTFFNDNLSFSFEGYLIFLIFVAQIMTKYIGMDKEDVYNSENIYQSYIRKCVNDLEFRQDFIENCLQPTNEDNMLKNIDQISPIYKKTQDKPNLFHIRQMSQQQFDGDNQLFRDENLNKNTQNLLNKQMKIERDQSTENQNDFDNIGQLKKQPSLNKQGSLQHKNTFKQNPQLFLEDQTLSEAEENNKIQIKSNQDILLKSFNQGKNNLLSISEQERSISMHEQMLKDLKQKPDLLVNDTFKKENFFKRVFSNYNKRSGKDFYPWIALVQVIILLFIFIFYTRMDANNTQGINEQLKYNQFSGEMVICLFIQVAFMVFERYLALRRVSEKTKKEKPKKKKEKNSSSSDNSNDSDLSTSNNLSQTQIIDEEDSLIQKKQKANKAFDSFDEKAYSRQNQPRSQSQIKRKPTFKKEVNIKHLRSSTKISQEYDTYKNFQEMQSLVLNQEDDEEIDNKKQNKILKDTYKDALKQQDHYEEKQIDNEKQQNKKGYDQKDFEIVNDTPQNRVRSFASHTRNSKEYDEDVFKLRQQHRLSLVLREEIIFANLEKEQINANLQNFKQYGNLITKNKDSNNLDSSLSSSDDQKSFLQDSSVNLSQGKNINKKKSNQNTPQNKKGQTRDLENQIEETKKSSNQKEKNQMVSYPTDNIIKYQDETEANQNAINKQKKYNDPVILPFEQQQGIQSSQDEDNQDFKSDASASDNVSINKNKKEKPKESFVLTTELLKFIQLTVFLILFSWFVFFYVPQSFQKNTISDQKVVVNYSTNGYLIAFVFIVMIYLLLSTLQLRYGYKKLKLRNTILQFKNTVAGFCAVVVRAIPFLQELKVILDWTVTKTSLTLFQWFLLEDIHYSLYVAKLDSKDVRSTKVDAPQSKLVKIFLGLLQVIVILLLIFGPMLLFSTLNPISDYNGITSGEIEVGIQFKQLGQINYYPIFTNSHTNNLQTVQRDCTYDPQKNVNNQDASQQECYWDEYKFRDVNIIYTTDSQQFQKFNFYSYSENSWDLSFPSKKDIESKFEDILNNQNTSQTAQLVIKLVLNRKVSQYNTAPYISYYPNPQIQNSSYLNKQIIQGFYDTLTDCQKPGVILPNFYIFLLSSTISNQSYISSPINHEDNNNSAYFAKDSYIQLKCQDIQNPQTQKYWEISIDQAGTSGLSYFVVTDKYSQATFGFSIITLYTSVILVIGKFIRDAFGGELEKIIIKCMPNPDELLRICEAISNARNEKDLLKERILYFELMDLIRSPEVLKKLTGSYSFVLNQKHKLDLQQEEIDKAFKKRKRLIKKKLANKKKKEKQRLQKLLDENKETQNKEETQHDEQNKNFQIEEQAEEEEEYDQITINQFLKK
ncbi:transmembrane protein, putative (macronuclear) [Tetrahymena thermophila SB210]|uniref:Transmembrane protein, putative n=1 Tax=Tetrahymena thermophila (strain SB210) TaxID=312017 RepID=I7LWE1_TETTS|nr:transmembrane protein, putative [Tetrahymena thermophila SB210]EAS01458.2 transmembrane protein, putative [Tetrahymena thermophila SB210]|eukprot:XP_001021704.2 transmembrane protein, putative [Tetrahymena thermophila SB210]